MSGSSNGDLGHEDLTSESPLDEKQLSPSIASDERENHSHFGNMTCGPAFTGVASAVDQSLIDTFSPDAREFIEKLMDEKQKLRDENYSMKLKAENDRFKRAFHRENSKRKRNGLGKLELQDYWKQHATEYSMLQETGGYPQEVPVLEAPLLEAPLLESPDVPPEVPLLDSTSSSSPSSANSMFVSNLAERIETLEQSAPKNHRVITLKRVEKTGGKRVSVPATLNDLKNTASIQFGVQGVRLRWEKDFSEINDIDAILSGDVLVVFTEEENKVFDF